MRGKVLIVDDDRDIVETLRLILELHGFGVLVAHNGREALDQFDAGERPCMVVLDERMPVMTGSEFLARRQADEVLKKTPVVVVTASEPPPAVSGLDVVLRKPVDLPLLLEKVKAACAWRTEEPV